MEGKGGDYVGEYTEGMYYFSLNFLKFVWTLLFLIRKYLTPWEEEIDLTPEKYQELETQVESVRRTVIAKKYLPLTPRGPRQSS